MDSYGNRFTYSSHEQDWESYPHVSNFEESQNQVVDQRYYEDECYNGNGQYYEDGGYYEDGMHSYNQQVMCNEGYDQWREQPNYHREEQFYPYASSFDDSQPYYEEDSYDQCYSNPQFNGESSNSKDNIEHMIEMAKEILALQKEISKDLGFIRAQQAKEMEYDQEVGPIDLYPRVCDCGVYDQEEGYHNAQWEEQSYSTHFENPLWGGDESLHEELGETLANELETHHEDALKGEDLVPRGFDLHEDFVEEHINLDEEQPCIREEISLKEDCEIWTPMDTIEELKEGVPINLEASVEDPFFFTLPLDKFRSFIPYISRSLERSSYNPFMLKGISIFKRLFVHLEVHCRLDGRKFKWDLKVD